MDTIQPPFQSLFYTSLSIWYSFHRCCQKSLRNLLPLLPPLPSQPNWRFQDRDWLLLYNISGPSKMFLGYGPGVKVTKLRLNYPNLPRIRNYPKILRVYQDYTSSVLTLTDQIHRHREWLYTFSLSETLFIFVVNQCDSTYISTLYIEYYSPSVNLCIRLDSSHQNLLLHWNPTIKHTYKN